MPNEFLHERRLRCNASRCRQPEGEGAASHAVATLATVVMCLLARLSALQRRTSDGRPVDSTGTIAMITVPTKMASMAGSTEAATTLIGLLNIAEAK